VRIDAATAGGPAEQINGYAGTTGITATINGAGCQGHGHFGGCTETVSAGGLTSDAVVHPGGGEPRSDQLRRHRYGGAGPPNLPHQKEITLDALRGPNTAHDQNQLSDAKAQRKPMPRTRARCARSRMAQIRLSRMIAHRLPTG
jgi:hypothetical protein